MKIYKKEETKSLRILRSSNSQLHVLQAAEHVPYQGNTSCTDQLTL